jgi:hypothetical protein
MRGRTPWTIAAAVVTAILVGCGSGATDTPAPTGATAIASQRPSSTAKLSIISPSTGDILPAGDITLRVKLTGATIVAITSTKLEPDQGHLHVILDDQLISMTSGTTTTLSNVGPGTYLLKVEFVANDHAPFDPRVIAATSFTVK